MNSFLAIAVLIVFFFAGSIVLASFFGGSERKERALEAVKPAELGPSTDLETKVIAKADAIIRMIEDETREIPRPGTQGLQAEEPAPPTSIYDTAIMQSVSKKVDRIKKLSEGA